MNCERNVVKLLLNDTPVFLVLMRSGNRRPFVPVINVAAVCVCALAGVMWQFRIDQKILRIQFNQFTWTFSLPLRFKLSTLSAGFYLPLRQKRTFSHCWMQILENDFIRFLFSFAVAVQSTQNCDTQKAKERNKKTNVIQFARDSNISFAKTVCNLLTFAHETDWIGKLIFSEQMTIKRQGKEEKRRERECHSNGRWVMLWHYINLTSLNFKWKNKFL